MIDKAQQFWDKQANRFNKSEKQFDRESVELIAMTREYLDAGDNVLDFGCATGTKTLMMAESVRHIHGLDFSAEMINEAVKKIKTENITNVSFSRGTIFSNNMEDASFDKVVAFSIIHLLEESDKAVQRIHKLLKPAGLFISATTCFGEKKDFKIRMEYIVMSFMKLLGIFPLQLNKFTSARLEMLIRNSNFKILRSEKLFFNGMTVSFIVAEA